MPSRSVTRHRGAAKYVSNDGWMDVTECRRVGTAARVRRRQRAAAAEAPGSTRHCMNQPWLTTNDWPVSAFDGNEANNNATSATSCTVVN
jgi:hypothetical protein